MNVPKKLTRVEEIMLEVCGYNCDDEKEGKTCLVKLDRFNNPIQLTMYDKYHDVFIDVGFWYNNKGDCNHISYHINKLNCTISEWIEYDDRHNLIYRKCHKNNGEIYEEWNIFDSSNRHIAYINSDGGHLINTYSPNNPNKIIYDRDHGTLNTYYYSNDENIGNKIESSDDPWSSNYYYDENNNLKEIKTFDSSNNLQEHEKFNDKGYLTYYFLHYSSDYEFTKEIIYDDNNMIKEQIVNGIKVPYNYINILKERT